MIMLTSSKSVIELIEKVVEKANSYKSLTPETFTVYRHKTDPSKFFEGTDTNLSNAFKSGESLSDFDSAIEVINPKDVLMQMTFGSRENINLSVLPEFIKICEALTGTKIELKSTEKTPEQQERETAKQLIYNTATAVRKGDKTQKDLDEAIEATKVVYQKYGKTYTYKPDGRKGKKAINSNI
jgi:SpoU rRNA methylase family enzyme